MEAGCPGCLHPLQVWVCCWDLRSARWQHLLHSLPFTHDYGLRGEVLIPKAMVIGGEAFGR